MEPGAAASQHASLASLTASLASLTASLASQTAWEALRSSHSHEEPPRSLQPHSPAAAGLPAQLLPFPQELLQHKSNSKTIQQFIFRYPQFIIYCIVFRGFDLLPVPRKFPLFFTSLLRMTRKVFSSPSSASIFSILPNTLRV